MHLIQNQSDLTALAQNIMESKEDFITLDTEFIRQKTFWPELCVLQISLGNECFVVDCLVDSMPIDPVLEALYACNKTWILHACKQDLEIFFHRKKHLPAKIFDTQIASTFLGFGESISYDSLVRHYLHHTLDKSLQHTDWGRRPLTYDMFAYAAGDVIYLSELYPKMLADLKQKGRLGWALDEMQTLSDSEQFFNMSPARLKRLEIPQKNYPMAKRIFAFRDIHASALNLNRGSILLDKIIHSLCRMSDVQKMHTLLNQSAKVLVEHGLVQELLEEIEKSQHDMHTPPSFPTGHQAKEIFNFKQRRDQRAKELDLPANFLANAEDIKEFVLFRKGRLLTTWRREIF